MLVTQSTMTESNRVEYKRESTDGLEKEVVAFLNAREGGLLYIGLDDDGKAVGVQSGVVPGLVSCMRGRVS